MTLCQGTLTRINTLARGNGSPVTAPFAFAAASQQVTAADRVEESAHMSRL